MTPIRRVSANSHKPGSGDAVDWQHFPLTTESSMIRDSAPCQIKCPMNSSDENSSASESRLTQRFLIAVEWAGNK